MTPGTRFGIYEISSLLGIGRLAPGTTLVEARREMESVTARLEAAYPDTNSGWDVGMAPLHASVVAELRPALLLLQGVSGLVLLIA